MRIGKWFEEYLRSPSLDPQGQIQVNLLWIKKTHFEAQVVTSDSIFQIHIHIQNQAPKPYVKICLKSQGSFLLFVYHDKKIFTVRDENS